MSFYRVKLSNLFISDTYTRRQLLSKVYTLRFKEDLSKDLVTDDECPGYVNMYAAISNSPLE